MKMYIENIQDLKEDRKDIIERIIFELESEDMKVVKKVMNQMVSIVTSSNYQDLEYDFYELIEESCKVVTLSTGHVTIEPTDISGQLPSSMRN